MEWYAKVNNRLYLKKKIDVSGISSSCLWVLVPNTNPFRLINNAQRPAQWKGVWELALLLGIDSCPGHSMGYSGTGKGRMHVKLEVLSVKCNLYLTQTVYRTVLLIPFEPPESTLEFISWMLLLSGSVVSLSFHVLSYLHICLYLGLTVCVSISWKCSIQTSRGKKKEPAITWKISWQIKWNIQKENTPHSGNLGF